MKQNDYFNKIDEIIENIEVNTRVRQMQDNSEKLQGYWNIGKLLVKAQGGNKRAKYGNNLIKIWGEILSNKYGNFYGRTNLNYMRQFYLMFPIVHTVYGQLTWSHYQIIFPIKNKNERNYYINQTILNRLFVRELKNEIKN